MEAKERITYWDNFKGIAIILVVFGHFLYYSPDNSWLEFPLALIYSFHMPAFVFISGFFSKSKNSSSASSILKLVFAYLVFNGLMQLLLSNYTDFFYLLSPSYSFWYLIALIVWRVTTPYISKIKMSLPISVLVAIMIGFWGDVDNTFAMSRILSFYPFFLAGNLVPESFTEKMKNRHPAIMPLGGIIAFMGLLLFSIVYERCEISRDVLIMMSYTDISQITIRIIIFFTATMTILGLLLCIPYKAIPIVNKWGRNSLAIYLLHLFVIIILNKVFEGKFNSAYDYAVFACVSCIILLPIIGSNIVSKTMKRFLEIPVTKDRKPEKIIAAILVVTITVVPFVYAFNEVEVEEQQLTAEVLSEKEQEAIEKAVTISFSGDLILMRDQIVAAKNKYDNSYDFSAVFSYTKQYIEEADYAIADFEGPTAGESVGYTSGNYDYGIPLEFNFPDSFVSDIKNAGYDMVTTANNHLLDKGYEGAMATLNVLDEEGLAHIGSYRSKKEKENVFVTNIKGIKVAFLAYTYGLNNYENEDVAEKYSSLTSLLADPFSGEFKQCKKNVKADFERAKALSPDCIVVMPHMGTQFSTETDKYQSVWNEYFTELGADIILGDHAQIVQPIEYLTVGFGKDKNTALVVNCPGNFVNGYTGNKGDAGAMVEVYIDSDTKKPMCAAVIPTYITQNADGIYCPIPIYKIFTDDSFIMTNYEKKHAKKLHSFITKTMLGVKVPIDQMQERYYYTEEGYKRMPVKSLKDIPNNSAIGNAIKKSDSVCFVGDSITAGSNNGGFGWHEPLMGAFPDVKVSNVSFGGATTKKILKKLEKQSCESASLYVIALGANDILFRKDSTCAMTSKEFADYLNKITKKIKKTSPDARFAFISPWHSLDNGICQEISNDEKEKLFEEYTKAEQDFCSQNGYMFINVSDALDEAIEAAPYDKYLLDDIHPNAVEGIYLYSQMVANVTE